MERLLSTRATRPSRTPILKAKDLVRWKYNRFMHDYLACIKGVDDNVGRF